MKIKVIKLPFDIEIDLPDDWVLWRCASNEAGEYAVVLTSDVPKGGKSVKPDDVLPF